MVDEPKVKIKTTKQFVILSAAFIADLIWCCLPGYAVAVAGGFITPADGALGKGWGFFLLLALAIAATLLWIPTAEKISAPLVKKLAKRLGVIRDKEE